MKELCKEAPYKEPEYFPWNEETRKQHNLDPLDVKLLEEGKVVWVGDIGYSLEEAE